MDRLYPLPPSSDSHGSTTDGWSYAGSGNYSLPDNADGTSIDTSGTITESGGESTVSGYSVHAAWNGDLNDWEKSASKSVTAETHGHWDRTGSDSADEESPTLTIVHRKDWSSNHTSAQTRATGSTVWTTTKDDTTYRTSADDSFDTVITDRPYGITSGLPLHGPVGTSQQTHHVENTNTYAFGHTLGVDGTYHPFGSGSATNVDQTEIDYAGARETPILRDESVSDSYLGTYTDRLTGELSYHEHGHKLDATSVTTDWTLDDALGGWRAAQTDRVESGTAEAFSDYVETEHYLYEDAYPENTIISDTTQTGTVHWGNDYTNHLVSTTDTGGVLSASGTGEREGYGQGTTTLDAIDSRGYSYYSQDSYDLSVNAPQTFSLTGVTPDQPLPITNHQTGSYEASGPDGSDSNSYDTTVSQNWFSPDAYNLGYYGDSYYGSDVPNPFGVSIDTGYHRNGQTLPSTPTGTPPTPSIPPSGNPNAPAKPTVALPAQDLKAIFIDGFKKDFLVAEYANPNSILNRGVSRTAESGVSHHEQVNINVPLTMLKMVGAAAYDAVDFGGNFVAGVIETNTGQPIGKVQSAPGAWGRNIGRALATAQGSLEMLGGGLTMLGGSGASATGIGAVAGVPAIAAGAVVTAHGALVAANAVRLGAVDGHGSMLTELFQKSEADIHHIMTDKNNISKAAGGPFTPEFEKLAARRGITLQDAMNKMELPGHQGPHPEYNAEVYQRMRDATQGLGGEAFNKAFDKELINIRGETAKLGTLLNDLATGK